MIHSSRLLSQASRIYIKFCWSCDGVSFVHTTCLDAHIVSLFQKLIHPSIFVCFRTSCESIVDIRRTRISWTISIFQCGANGREGAYDRSRQHIQLVAGLQYHACHASCHCELRSCAQDAAETLLESAFQAARSIFG